MQKIKAQFRLFIDYEGDEATTDNIASTLQGVVEHLEDYGMLSGGFDMDVAGCRWGVEFDTDEEAHPSMIFCMAKAKKEEEQ